jgi:hypothetical protein
MLNAFGIAEVYFLGRVNANSAFPDCVLQDTCFERALRYEHTFGELKNII